MEFLKLITETEYSLWIKQIYSKADEMQKKTYHFQTQKNQHSKINLGKRKKNVINNFIKCLQIYYNYM